MRTITVREWLVELGLEKEIISQTHTSDTLTVAGMETVKRHSSKVIRAINSRTTDEDYIYLTPTARYHSIVLKD